MFISPHNVGQDLAVRPCGASTTGRLAKGSAGSVTGSAGAITDRYRPTAAEKPGGQPSRLTIQTMYFLPRTLLRRRRPFVGFLDHREATAVQLIEMILTRNCRAHNAPVFG